MYIYISAQVANDAQTHQIALIETLKQRIESDPSLFSLLFSSRFPYWIRRIGNLRLIASLELFGENRVLYFSHILSRGGNEYRDFLNNPRLWGEQHINRSHIQAWLDLHDKATSKEVLIPDYLCRWLERPTLMQQEDKVIYESSIWVEYFQKRNSSSFEQLPIFYDIVAQLVGAEPLKYKIQNTPYTKVQLYSDAQTGYSVLFSRICPQDDQSREILFLLGAFNKVPTNVEIANIGNQLNLFGSLFLISFM